MTEPHRLSAALADRYRIERELGAGGMATVYLAHDVRHDRKVAIKVLKPELAAVLGAERFVVEIRTTAALSHPHILPLFDSGTADGFLYYVMPFIKGETIREKLNRETQFGVDEAVRIAREVADALDYAHRNGVIHRDIKPENILLHDGRAMVMDFGIALAVSAAAGGRMTETGLSLGTPHYMSPEQATADKEITGRSDIYSLASVLYEMLAGQPPHLGGSAQQIIMKIIAEPVDTVTRYRKSVPPNVASALAKALEKLPADRFESARAFADALSTAGFAHVTSSSVSLAPAKPERSWSTIAAWATAGVLAVVSAAGWLRRPAVPDSIRLDIDVGDITVLPRDIVLSPDGSMIAVPGDKGGEQAIWVRRLHGDGEFQKVPGTEGGIYPSFSPDNQWIVFRRHAARTLVKVRVTGGSAVTLVAPGPIDPYSPHWGTDSYIVFSSPQGNYRVSASGGKPELLDRVTGRTPFLLADGSGVLFSRSGVLSFYEFASDSIWEIGAVGSHPVLVESQFLVHVNERGALVASRFDPAARRSIGAPLQLAERVGSMSNSRGFSISRNGTLVLIDAEPTGGLGESATRLVMGTIGGPTDTLRLPSGRRVQPRFSPDGRTLAYRLEGVGRLGDGDIYTFDLVSGTNTQLTFGGSNDEPTWSPDGKRILFSRVTDSTSEDLFVKQADNSAPEQLLLPLPGNQWPTAWASEDQIVLVAETPNGPDLVLWSPSKGGSPTPYLATPWAEQNLRVSPDGKLAAFVSNEAGAAEIWIRDFPVPQGKWRVSRGLSAAPRWSSDGRYLFYTHAGGGSGIDTLYRVLISRNPLPAVSPSRDVLFIGDIDGIANWDLHPDGKRFVVSLPESGEGRAASAAAALRSPPRFFITLNWVAALEREMAQQAKQ